MPHPDANRPRALAAALLLALAGACAPPAEPPNVLLVVVDTLRADRLSCAGYGRETTPNLDALAAEGLRFTHAQSPRAKTTPAVASLMTGLYPQGHGVRDHTQPLADDVPVLAEAFGSAGYSTAAVIGNWVLRRELSGLDRGFDRWVEELPDTAGVPPVDVPQRRATSLTDAAIDEIEHAATEGKPWFLWLQYMDPHGIYDAPEEHRVFRSDEADPIPDFATLPEHPIHRGRLADYNVPDEARLPDGRVDANRVRDLYDAEVRYVDAELGRLLDWMRAQGLLERTIVVVTGDHGESLGEHRYWFEHGLFTYEASCRVPLLLRLPAGHPDRPEPGVRRDDVSLCDLGPTLADLARLPEPFRPPDRPGPEGVSRASLVLGDSRTIHAVFSEKVERATEARVIQAKAVRIGDWKLIRRYTHKPEADPETGRRMVVLSEELYDLASDPDEERDLVHTPPDDAPLDRLRTELLRFFEADIALPDLGRLLEIERERLRATDPEAVRILEALGY